RMLGTTPYSYMSQLMAARAMGAQSAGVRTAVGFMLLHDLRIRLVARIEGVASGASEQYVDNAGCRVLQILHGSRGSSRTGRRYLNDITLSAFGYRCQYVAHSAINLEAIPTPGSGVSLSTNTHHHS